MLNTIHLTPDAVEGGKPPLTAEQNPMLDYAERLEKMAIDFATAQRNRDSNFPRAATVVRMQAELTLLKSYWPDL